MSRYIKNLKELIDQARILAHKESSEEIAEYLSNLGVVPFPLSVGDTAYFLVAKAGLCGGLLISGYVAPRKVDAVSFDGKIKIISYGKPCEDVGNLYEYYGETVFRTEEEAEKALNELKGNNKIGEVE